MSKFNMNDIKKFAEWLCFSIQDAEEIVEIFDLKFDFKSIESCITEYEDNWHRESSWTDIVEGEKEYGILENDIADKVGNTIFKLSSGLWIVGCY